MRSRLLLVTCQVMALSLIVTVSYKLAKASLLRRGARRNDGSRNDYDTKSYALGNADSNGNVIVRNLRKSDSITASSHDRDYGSWSSTGMANMMTAEDAEAAVVALGDEVLTLGTAAQDALGAMEDAAVKAFLGKEEDDLEDEVFFEENFIRRDRAKSTAPVAKVRRVATNLAMATAEDVKPSEEGKEQAEDDAYGVRSTSPYPYV